MSINEYINSRSEIKNPRDFGTGRSKLKFVLVEKSPSPRIQIVQVQSNRKTFGRIEFDLGVLNLSDWTMFGKEVRIFWPTPLFTRFRQEQKLRQQIFDAIEILNDGDSRAFAKQLNEVGVFKEEAEMFYLPTSGLKRSIKEKLEMLTLPSLRELSKLLNPEIKRRQLMTEGYRDRALAS
jgi:hypothetical protein